MANTLQSHLNIKVFPTWLLMNGGQSSLGLLRSISANLLRDLFTGIWRGNHDQAHGPIVLTVVLYLLLGKIAHYLSVDLANSLWPKVGCIQFLFLVCYAM
ncbi:MAG: hypothetical protein V9G21_09180 [Methylotenera sp.]